MTDEEMTVVDTMKKYGGDFVKALAECFYHADPNNFTKLKATFVEYWIQYEKMTQNKNI